MKLQENSALSTYQNIYSVVRCVPAGKVACYGQVADLAGLPGRARLVGKALSKVADELQVPWYRILRASGQIAFPAGSELNQTQSALLQQENVLVRNNRVKLSVFQWQPNLSEMLWKLKF